MLKASKTRLLFYASFEEIDIYSIHILVTILFNTFVAIKHTLQMQILVTASGTKLITGANTIYLVSLLGTLLS